MSYQNFENVTVTEVIAREWNGKTLYSLKHTGSDDTIGAGEGTPKFQQGSVISFTAKQNTKGFYNMDRTTLQVSSQAPASVPEPAATASKPAAQRASSSGSSRDDYWAKKEARDVEKDARYQAQDIPRMSFSASQERAVHLVAAALTNDCIALGQSKGKRMDILLEQVDIVTRRFFLQSMDAPGILARAEEEAAQVMAAKDAAVPEEFQTEEVEDF